MPERSPAAHAEEIETTGGDPRTPGKAPRQSRSPAEGSELPTGAAGGALLLLATAGVAVVLLGAW